MEHLLSAVSALSLVMGAASAPLQLLPAGEFRSRDDRPQEVPHWHLGAAGAARLLAQLRTQATRLVIDYEHQTLYSEKNGQPAPAAGWIDPADIEWREGTGLVARKVEWTERAAAMIDRKEYRYFSPVFEYDKATGAVTKLRLGALTNNPGLDGMAAVALSSLSHLHPHHHQETPVNETLKKLLAALGLPEATSESDAIAGVAALKAKADTVDGLQTEVAALKAQAPDPAKFAPVETMNQLQSQVAALTAQIAQGEAAQVIDAAISDGKLLPAQREWAEELGKTNLAALKSYVESAPKVAPANGQSQTLGRKPEGDGTSVSESELAVCKAMGLTAEEFLKSKEG